MKKYIFLIFLFASGASRASMLDLFIVSGNAENLFSGIGKKDSILNPGNVLAIPDISNIAELRVNVTSKDKSTFNIDARERYDTSVKSFDFILDQAYFSTGAGKFLKLRLGKQRIGFGAGYLWNPVNDLDVRKDVYNPAKYTQGTDALKLTLDFSRAMSGPMSVSAEILPTSTVSSLSDLSYSKFASQFYVLNDNMEFGLAASYGKNRHDITGDSALLGGFSTVDIGGMILGAEYSYSKRQGADYYAQALLNLNKRTSEKSFLMLEYFYNGYGYSGADMDNLLNLLRSSYSVNTAAPLMNIGYVSRNYFFGTFSHELTDNIGIAVNTLVNLDRAGSFVYPQVSWTKIENLNLSFEYIASVFSDKVSEFSLSPYSGVFFFRAQYFF